MNKLILFVLITLCTSVFAFEQIPANLQISDSIIYGEEELSQKQLENVVNMLNTARKDASILLNQINRLKDNAEKKRVQTDLDKVNRQIDNLIASIEKIAAGKLENDMRVEEQNKGFDWQVELEDVFKPIVVELKKMTERPRKIEKLRIEKTFYEEQLPAAAQAIEQIAKINHREISPDLKKELNRIEARWHKRHTEIQNKLKLVTHDLEQILTPGTGGTKFIITSLKSFIFGRGLSLLLAIFIFSFSLYTLRTSQKYFYNIISLTHQKRQAFHFRLIKFLFSALSIFISIMLAMTVLSIRGDWFLLGLLLIVLASSCLSLRHSLPLLYRKSKILLNIGSVREDERIIYNGLPWKVTQLNVYSILVNPLLTGGHIRISLDELSTLTSRPTSNKESWFPTKENDFVILSDNTFGRILAQTPEYVEMLTLGSVQTFSVQNFLGKNPRNLSTNGFIIMAHLGIDYRHQLQMTSLICERLEAYISEKIHHQIFAAHINSLTVEFNEVTASTLNFVIIADFNGNAAEYYNSIRRLLNKLCVDASNHFGWTMPFNQLSVHVETPIHFKSENVPQPFNSNKTLKELGVIS